MTSLRSGTRSARGYTVKGGWLLWAVFDFSQAALGHGWYARFMFVVGVFMLIPEQWMPSRGRRR